MEPSDCPNEERLKLKNRSSLYSFGKFGLDAIVRRRPASQLNLTHLAGMAALSQLIFCEMASGRASFEPSHVNSFIYPFLVFGTDLLRPCCRRRPHRALRVIRGDFGRARNQGSSFPAITWNSVFFSPVHGATCSQFSLYNWPTMRVTESDSWEESEG